MGCIPNESWQTQRFPHPQPPCRHLDIAFALENLQLIADQELLERGGSWGGQGKLRILIINNHHDLCCGNLRIDVTSEYGSKVLKNMATHHCILKYPHISYRRAFQSIIWCLISYNYRNSCKFNTRPSYEPTYLSYNHKSFINHS